MNVDTSTINSLVLSTNKDKFALFMSSTTSTISLDLIGSPSEVDTGFSSLYVNVDGALVFTAEIINYSSVNSAAFTPLEEYVKKPSVVGLSGAPTKSLDAVYNRVDVQSIDLSILFSYILEPIDS